MEQPDHKIYKRADPKDADAVCWAFTSNTTFEKYYYKHPPLGDDEIRLRITYTGLCMSDPKTGRSLWGDIAHPVCAGHEVIGKVVAIGKDVTGFEIGETCAFGPFRDGCRKCDWCKQGWNHACVNLGLNLKLLYNVYFGGYSTHIQQPAFTCYKLPEKLDVTKAAPLLCAGITVYLPLSLHVEKHHKVAVYGIGGLGHMAIQFAKALGKEVHAFTRTKDKEELCKKLGADKVILWDDFYNGKIEYEYDVIINTLPVWQPEEKINKWILSLKPYGKLLLVGIPSNQEKMLIDSRELIWDHKTVVGSLVGGRKHTEEMLQFAADHNIECMVEQYEWEDFPKALDKLENGKPHFRGVVKVDDVSKEWEEKNKK